MKYFYIAFYTFKIFIVGEIAMEWEERLMEEMCRLTTELEQVHLEERKKALEKLKGENLSELQKILAEQKQIEQQLAEEVKNKTKTISIILINFSISSK